MNAYLGRLLTPADDVRGGPAEGWPVVLSYGFWKDNFGGDPSIIGKQIKVSNTIVTVVGVAPPNFRGVWPGSETKLYLPFQFLTVVTGKDEINAPNSLWWCSTIGRLKPAVSVEQARAELATYQKALISQFIPLDLQDRFQARNAYLWVSSARTGLPTFFGRVYSTPLYLMQGLVGIVLLLCCVNVAGLMMSKVYSRRQEFAVRTAIGAARWRLIRQYLTESFVIALAGAALGAAAAWYGTGYLLPFFRHPNEGIGLSINPDATVFARDRLLRCADHSPLRHSARLASWRRRSRQSLEIAHRGCSPAPHFGPSLYPPSSRTLVCSRFHRDSALSKPDPAGDRTNRIRPRSCHHPNRALSPPESDAEARMELYHRMKNRLEQLPGINSASFTLLHADDELSIDIRLSSGQQRPQPSRGFTYGLQRRGSGLLPHDEDRQSFEGREFQDNERDRSVCVLNQSAAAYLFPRQQAVGQYVRSTDEKRFPQPVACRVVGLAQDAKFANLHEPPPRTIYFPVQLETLRNTNLVFLLNAPTKAQAIAAYRKAKSELSPATPFVLFVTLREQMEAALGSQRALSLMSNFFAGLALFLSGLGLYGLLSSSVAQRTSEIGVRMALGAERSRVLRMILSEALGLLAAGLVLGAIVLAVTVRIRGRNALRGVRLRSHKARRDHHRTCPRRDRRRPVPRAARRIGRSDSGSARRVGSQFDWPSFDRSAVV